MSLSNLKQELKDDLQIDELAVRTTPRENWKPHESRVNKRKRKRKTRSGEPDLNICHQDYIQRGQDATELVYRDA